MANASQPRITRNAAVNRSNDIRLTSSSFCVETRDRHACEKVLEWPDLSIWVTRPFSESKVCCEWDPIRKRDDSHVGSIIGCLFFFLIKRGSVQIFLNNATTHMNLESDSLNILVCTALLFLTVLKYVCREAVFFSCSGHDQREEWSGIDILRNCLCPTDHCGLADADRQAPSGQHSGTASFFLPLKKIIDSRSK